MSLETNHYLERRFPDARSFTMYRQIPVFDSMIMQQNKVKSLRQYKHLLQAHGNELLEKLQREAWDRAWLPVSPDFDCPCTNVVHPVRAEMTCPPKPPPKQKHPRGIFEAFTSFF